MQKLPSQTVKVPDRSPEAQGFIRHTVSTQEVETCRQYWWQWWQAHQSSPKLTTQASFS